MRNLWLLIRLPLAVFCLLVLTLALARLFSGPEDTWIKNEQGEWVRHGHPAGPPPPDDYQEPRIHFILPLLFLAGFVVPLFFIGAHKPQNRLTYEMSKRDTRIFGYLSMALPLTGILVFVGLGFELCLANSDAALPENQMPIDVIFLIFSLACFSGLCVLLGAVFYALKRNCSDHYYLEKSRRELIEALENHSHSGQ